MKSLKNWQREKILWKKESLVKAVDGISLEIMKMENSHALLRTN